MGEALSTFAEARRSLHAAGNFVDELDSTVVLADMWVASGRPRRARRLYEQALHTATTANAPYRGTADLHVGLAELDRELDDLTGAVAHLETAQTLAERASITENRHTLQTRDTSSVLPLIFAIGEVLVVSAVFPLLRGCVQCLVRRRMSWNFPPLTATS